VRTGAVAEREGDDHAVARAEPVDLVADGDDLAGRLVPEDLAARDAVVRPLAVAGPSVPVAATDAAGVDADDGAVGFRFGVGQLADRERLAVLSQDRCAHTAIHRRPRQRSLGAAEARPIISRVSDLISAREK
jgi:hypothetical protein